MMLRRPLSGLCAGVLAGAAWLVPLGASAASPRIAVENDRVSFYEGGSSAGVLIDYRCGRLGSSTDGHLHAAVYQPTAGSGWDGQAVGPKSGTLVVCDGFEHRGAPVQLDVRVGFLVNGPAEAAMYLEDDDEHIVVQKVVVVGLPADVALTTNATPEPAQKGHKITVKGTITIADRPVRANVALYFAKDHGDFSKVKTVKSNSSGKLSTTVRATRSGTFAYAYDVTISSGDHVKVVPAAKKDR